MHDNNNKVIDDSAHLRLCECYIYHLYSNVLWKSRVNKDCKTVMHVDNANRCTVR